MARGSWQQQTKESDALVKPRFRPCHICDRKYTDSENGEERETGDGRRGSVAKNGTGSQKAG